MKQNNQIPERTLKIIGITGPIGSGKSTVSRVLSNKGIIVLDADLISRDVVEKGKKAYDEIVGYFGTGILNENGILDRKKLGDLVFGDPVKLNVLNQITHKYIIEEIKARIQDEIKTGNQTMIVIDCPIPVKHGFVDLVDEIWVVTADQEVRVKRVMSRNGLSREEVLKRIASQMPESEYLKIADKIIYNNSGIEQVEKEVEHLINYTM